MQWYRRFAVVLVLGFPAPLVSQTVARADLVGTWVRTRDFGGGWPKEITTLILRDDSTLTEEIRSTRRHDKRDGHWYMAGDSLWLGDPGATDTGSSGIHRSTIWLRWPARKIILNKSTLFLPEYDAYERYSEEQKSNMQSNDYIVYERRAP